MSCHSDMWERNRQTDDECSLMIIMLNLLIVIVYLLLGLLQPYQSITERRSSGRALAVRSGSSAVWTFKMASNVTWPRWRQTMAACCSRSWSSVAAGRTLRWNSSTSWRDCSTRLTTLTRSCEKNSVRNCRCPRHAFRYHTHYLLFRHDINTSV